MEKRLFFIKRTIFWRKLLKNDSFYWTNDFLEINFRKYYRYFYWKNDFTERTILLNDSSVRKRSLLPCATSFWESIPLILPSSRHQPLQYSFRATTFTLISWIIPLLKSGEIVLFVMWYNHPTFSSADPVSLFTGLVLKEIFIFKLSQVFLFYSNMSDEFARVISYGKYLNINLFSTS